MSAAASNQYAFESLKVSVPQPFVYSVEINRPEKRNAMNLTFWKEMVTCFEKISGDPDCRVIVFSGIGKAFSAGIDLNALTEGFTPSEELDVSRRANMLKHTIAEFQNSFTVIEKCPKPVIAAVHNACVGAGVDLISACDMRYCTKDAFFQIKEIDLGIVADVGTLQRLPKIVGNEGLVRELAYTGRMFPAAEAKDMGLCSRVYEDRDTMMKSVYEMAALIASKSPTAIQGIKQTIIYARDHSVDESLRQVRELNQVLLLGEDVQKAITGMITKETPVFSKL